MKNLIITCFLLIVIATAACKKKTEPQPANFDVTNKIFRTYVNASAALLTVNITQIRPSLPNNPYGSVQAQQYSKFDYGFTPTVGDSINVSIKSAGPVYVSITYAGEDLPVTTKPTSGGGVTASFGYVVKN